MTNMQHGFPTPLATSLGGTGKNNRTGEILYSTTVIKVDTQSTSNTNGSWVDVTSLSIAYALSNASNSIRIKINVMGGATTGGAGIAWRVVKDGTIISPPDAPAVGFQAHAACGIGDGNAILGTSATVTDSPGDTSSHTYKVQFCGISGAAFTCYVNRTHNDDAAAYNVRTISSMTLEEISA